MTRNPDLDLDDAALEALNARFATASPQAILTWAWETFGPEEVAASSSFQTQSVPLLHIIAQTRPQMPVLFIDTGFHFPETLAFRDRLQARWDLNIHVVRPAISKGELFRKYGEGLYRHDPDLCCYINKVRPMQEALKSFRAWIAGVRRDQTKNRQGLEVVIRQTSDLLKIHPLLNWTEEQIAAYREAHELPVHPLYYQGYPSVGCAPCTRPVFSATATADGGDDNDARAGRWAGSDKEKTECGLHLAWDK
jgi:phosphoadenosine phosphosulfate reductase